MKIWREGVAEGMVRARTRDVCEQIISVCAVGEVSIIQRWAGGGQQELDVMYSNELVIV